MKVVINGDSMYPTLTDGSEVHFISKEPSVGDVVLAEHPFKIGLLMVKRVQSIENGRVFLTGDNPDPTASEDSHNFGPVSLDRIHGVMVSS